LKGVFDRGRPDLVPHLDMVIFASFPSGHSMLSAIVYLSLGGVLAQMVRPRRLKAFALAAAMLMAFLVGMSRIVLGVHYPTDVLAGWAAGLAWAFLWFLIVGPLVPPPAWRPGLPPALHGRAARATREGPFSRVIQLDRFSATTSSTQYPLRL
jgi:undecaprenyl-diphosphatase